MIADMERLRSVSYAGVAVQPRRNIDRLRPTVAIVGGGVGGCCSALELARTGKLNIFLLEKNRELMRETSDATPGRLGLGFHYSDKATALRFLHVTVDFIKRFGRFRQEIARKQSHPLRRGRYFIMKNSLVSVQDILKVYDAIKDEYTKMVREDPTCEVLGPPDDIYRIMEPHEFEGKVYIEKVAMGIETAEELLDWPRLREYIINQITERKENRVISVMTNTKVVAISARKGGGYIVEGLNTYHGGAAKISADFVVNSSWYNISKFNQLLGISSACRYVILTSSLFPFLGRTINMCYS